MDPKGLTIHWMTLIVLAIISAQEAWLVWRKNGECGEMKEGERGRKVWRRWRGTIEISVPLIAIHYLPFYFCYSIIEVLC